MSRCSEDFTNGEPMKHKHRVMITAFAITEGMPSSTVVRHSETPTRQWGRV